MDKLCMVEYGVPASVWGARVWARLSDLAPPPPIPSAGAYVGVCRRMDRRLRKVDGRLIAVGWNHRRPSRWVREDLAKFLAYWEKAVARPDTVGSSYNSSPECVFAAWQKRVPAHVVRLLRVDWSKARLHQAHLDAAKAASRTTAGRLLVRGRLSLKLLAALGKLCPELQRVAIASLSDKEGELRPLRIRDVDWAAVAVAQESLRKDRSGRVRAAMSLGERLVALAGAKPVPFLAPSFPRVSLEQAKALALGKTPVELASGVLSKKEAHDWLSSRPEESMVEYLQRYLPPEVPPLRSVPVIRWLLAVQRRGGWGGLTRARVVYGPAGAQHEFTALDRIDEIQDEDLVRGERTSVDEALQHAAERVGGTWAEMAREDHRILANLPTGWRPYAAHMTHLNTNARLAREGEEMSHCVAGYGSAVESRQSVIFGLKMFGQRSTVELSRTGRVLQHKGAHNTSPPAVCKRLLERFLERRVR